MAEQVRARRAGLALKQQRKLEQRYDEEDSLGTPERVLEWMNAALDGVHKPLFDYTPGKVIPWRNIQLYWRDGVVLCKFINVLLKSDGQAPVKFTDIRNTTPFMAMENITNFNEGCARYGVPKPMLFDSIDLYEGLKGPLINVVNCCNTLGFVANKKGFEPHYEAVEPPERDSGAWGET